jgi:hypothetical protein
MLDVECRGALAQCGVENDCNGIARLALDVGRQVGHANAQTQGALARTPVQWQEPHGAGIEANTLVGRSEIETHRRLERDELPTGNPRRVSNNGVHESENVGVALCRDDELAVVAVRLPMRRRRSLKLEQMLTLRMPQAPLR